MYMFIYTYILMNPYDIYICIFKPAQLQCAILLYQPPSYFWNQLPSNKESKSLSPGKKRKSMSLQLAIFF